MVAGYEHFQRQDDNRDVVDELLDPARGALVVVDMQNDYCDPQGALGVAGFDLSTIDPMCSVIEQLIDDAHRSRVPVIFLRNVHSDTTDSPAWKRKKKHGMEICREGTWGGEYYRLSPAGDDLEVVKHRYSGFVGTNLAQLLAVLQRTTLVMTGTATNVCVESTARHGCMLDYDVVVVEDAVAATDPAAHRASLQNIDRFFGHVTGSGTVRSAWSAASP